MSTKQTLTRKIGRRNPSVRIGLVFLGLLALLSTPSCKKDSPKTVVPKETCAHSLSAEYIYRVYYKGALDTNVIVSMVDGGDPYVIGLQFPTPGGGHSLRLDCDKGTFTMIGTDYPPGKIYGLDSMVIEGGDYKRVYINRKYSGL